MSTDSQILRVCRKAAAVLSRVDDAEERARLRDVFECNQAYYAVNGAKNEARAALIALADMERLIEIP